jgi:F-type H+-transporting ATPase subunit delta
MKEQNVSRAYAQSIIELCDAEKVDVADELTKLNVVINESSDLETLLFLDVFSAEEKLSVLNEVISKLSLSNIVKNFLNFLVLENRMGIFPLIFKEVIVIDDHNKGFLRGVIEGSEESVSPEFKAKMIAYLKEKLGTNAQLDYRKNENITAGYKVTVEDLQLDASLDSQLDKLKSSILNV